MEDKDKRNTPVHLKGMNSDRNAIRTTQSDVGELAFIKDFERLELVP